MGEGCGRLARQKCRGTCSHRVSRSGIGQFVLFRDNRIRALSVVLVAENVHFPVGCHSYHIFLEETRLGIYLCRTSHTLCYHCGCISLVLRTGRCFHIALYGCWRRVFQSVCHSFRLYNHPRDVSHDLSLYPAYRLDQKNL